MAGTCAPTARAKKVCERLVQLADKDLWSVRINQAMTSACAKERAWGIFFSWRLEVSHLRTHTKSTAVATMLCGLRRRTALLGVKPPRLLNDLKPIPVLERLFAFSLKIAVSKDRRRKRKQSCLSQRDNLHNNALNSVSDTAKDSSFLNLEKKPRCKTQIGTFFAALRPTAVLRRKRFQEMLDIGACEGRYNLVAACT